MKFEKVDYEKRLRDYLNSDIDQTYKNMLLNLFPELAESEDERIRKEILEYFQQFENEELRGVNISDWIAWLEKQGNKDMGISNTTKQKLKDNLDNALEKETPESWNEFLEKQGEQKPVEWHREDEQNLNACLGYIPDEFLRKWLTDVIHTKYDKPTDNVEPKFKVGDWVIDVQGVSSNLIIGYEDDSYYIETSCSKFYLPMKLAEKNYRLWTIQDAKDGDVLATIDYILVFKEFLKNDGGISYCHYDFGAGNPQFIWLEDKNWYFGKEAIIHPATKEQRNLLFKKMHEAGYEWDAEKKELNKIVTPIFNIGDTIIKKHNSDINDFGSFTITDITGGKYWYNDRIICGITEQNEWEIYEPVRQKSAWSEEDERRLNIICDLLEDIPSHQNWIRTLKDRILTTKVTCDENDKEKLESIINKASYNCCLKNDDISFLKSLKNRVQPQPKQEWGEEDDRMYNRIVSFIPQHLTAESYTACINWLKSLRPQKQWKPSEDQMKALYAKLSYVNGDRELVPDVILESLYNDLKKLREE